MGRDATRIIKLKANKLTGELYIPRTGTWDDGKPDNDCFTLPEYHNEWDNGVCIRTYHQNSVKIPIVAWADFLGWYLSEGHTTINTTVISQIKHRDEVDRMLLNLPFKYKKEKNGFVICSIQLSTYLKTLGKGCDSNN